MPWLVIVLNTFHDELIGLDDFLAGVAVLPVNGTAPEAGNAVMWQGAIVELAADGKANGRLIHGMPSGLANENRSQIHPSRDAGSANP